MPGVVSVQPRVQGGLLSQIGQVANTAGAIYGIKHASDMGDIAQARADREQQAFNDEQAGVFTPKEQVGLGRYYNTVDENTPNAIPIKVRTGPTDDDLQDVFILPKKQNASPLLKSVENYKNPTTGETGTAFFDMNNPTGSPLLFAATQKPAKEVTPHLTPLGTDANGNVVAFDTTTGKTSSVPIPGGGITKIGKPGEDPDAKAQAAAEKVYTELGTKLENPRGNKAVQTAQLNLLNIDNAKGLINKYGGRLDQMTPQDYNLLVGELSKISAGGVGNQHSQEAIAAQTLQSKFNNFLQSVSGQPTGAQLGQFIQNNKDYLDELEAVSTKAVHNYKLAIYNSYKNRLPPELQQRFMAEHGDLFPQGAGAAAVASGGAAGAPSPAAGFVGTANAGTGPAGAAPHPEDNAAVQWANQNLWSKDAATATKARQILQLNGVK